ncbi:MAG: menaquinone biosynthesis protein [Acidobacteria bacterium]|nr:menaquinone biosynthesis protein [Acidobacteriota bacterium]
MPSKPRVCAVSYLNTLPLVWGFLHGQQKDLLDLSFRLPSECADLLRLGQAEIGLPPAIELATQSDLVVIPGCSLSCREAVGSVLLACRKPIEDVQSLAADTGSRTSVALAQVVLARKYHRAVKVRPYPPLLEEMLDLADAALIIGDPALRLEKGVPDGVRLYDLGAEWVSLTRLPMVFAVWAVRRPAADPDLAAIFQASRQYGLAHIDQIAETEAPARGIAVDRARDYLSRNIRYEWGEPEIRGLTLFLEYAAELGLAPRKTSFEMLDEPAMAM